ncbi:MULTISPECIES: hypothetical protein [Burkholderia]|uniref:hypothetical protein n=1 Tax=Burkholderia TaxID=32008 RepID=UPI00126999F8|nr:MULTISPECIES: hypothetical protein [Burkholderia]
MIKIVTPDIISRVTMYPTDAGGKSVTIPPIQYRCPFSVNGELFDCRLLLNQVGISLSPGCTADIPIKFLYLNLVKDMLIPGAQFALWDMGNFADGTILEVTAPHEAG